MPLEDEIHARLRELTREVRKVREGLKKELRSSGRKPAVAANERMRGAAAAPRDRTDAKKTDQS
jgi:hypothetical protein